MEKNKIILATAVLLLFIAIPLSQAQEKSFFISETQMTFDSKTEVPITFNNDLGQLNALKINASYSNPVIQISNVESSREGADFNYDKDTALVYFSDPQNFGSYHKVIIITFTAEPKPGEKLNITLSGQYSNQSATEDIKNEKLSVTLSQCVNKPNSHSGRWGSNLPGTNCYCNSGFEPTLYTMPTNSKWICVKNASNKYGENAEKCGVNPKETSKILETGYCCKKGYQFEQDLTAQSILNAPEDVCTVEPNKRPFAHINSPDNNYNAKVGTSILFDSKGSYDPEQGTNCTGCLFSWDFRDGTNKTGERVRHTYSDPSACTNDENDTSCDVRLTVTDPEGDTMSSSITIYLEDIETEIEPKCGNGVPEKGEECDGNVADACESGICTSNCMCKQVEDKPEPEEESICGNGRCEFDEDSKTCIADCHCPDGECNYGETESSCPLDCKKSNTLLWVVVLSLVMVAVGGLYAFKKGMISLDMFKKKNNSDFGNKETPNNFQPISNSMMHMKNVNKPHTSGGSAIHNYIRAARARGMSYAQIKQKLLSKGWKEEQINKSFNQI